MQFPLVVVLWFFVQFYAVAAIFSIFRFCWNSMFLSHHSVSGAHILSLFFFPILNVYTKYRWDYICRQNGKMHWNIKTNLKTLRRHCWTLGLHFDEHFSLFSSCFLCSDFFFFLLCWVVTKTTFSSFICYRIDTWYKLHPYLFCLQFGWR